MEVPNHNIEVSTEDFKALCYQFAGASGWKRSNSKGSFDVTKPIDADPRRKLRHRGITFVEKVDTPA